MAEISVLVTQERWLWQHPRQAEVAIAGTVTLEGAAVPVSGQVDALIHTPEAVVIVDYKTGSHVPARAEEVPEPYLLQLNTYRALVSQLYPDRPIRCAILCWKARSGADVVRSEGSMRPALYGFSRTQLPRANCGKPW